MKLHLSCHYLSNISAQYYKDTVLYEAELNGLKIALQTQNTLNSIAKLNRIWTQVVLIDPKLKNMSHPQVPKWF